MYVCVLGMLMCNKNWSIRPPCEPTASICACHAGMIERLVLVHGFFSAKAILYPSLYVYSSFIESVTPMSQFFTASQVPDEWPNLWFENTRTLCHNTQWHLLHTHATASLLTFCMHCNISLCLSLTVTTESQISQVSYQIVF